MANKGRGVVRQPATKSPKMQKKMVRNKIAAGLGKKKWFCSSTQTKPRKV